MIARNSQKLAWTVLLLWFGVLWYFSSTPSREFDSLPFTVNDKIMHACYFFAGAMPFSWLLLSARGDLSAYRRTVLFSILLFSVFGLIDESHQLFVPGRSGGDVWDFAADVVGTVLGVTTAHVLSKKPEASTAAASVSI